MAVLFDALVVLLGAASAAEGAAEPPRPQQYVLDYPPVGRFCPPIRSTFSEVTQTMRVVRGRRFRQQRNGGYGLPIVQKVEGKHLLHVGADLGWYQVGEPVFSVAGGVVRVSEGPSFSEKGRPATERPKGFALIWGNLVVIEHRFPQGEYFTTVYGHLGPKRLVEVGDVVQAGQHIGAIGRKHARINGGYNPHLHFAVRRGRMAEVGATLFNVEIGGVSRPVRIAALGEQEMELEMPPGLPGISRLNVGGAAYPVTVREGKHYLPSTFLWRIQRPDFAIVGYALSAEGWEDPIAFLMKHQAHATPAPFLPAPRERR